MSQKQADKANKVIRTIIIVFAAVMAIVAIKYNPGHLFTASLVFAVGLNAELVEADEFDLRK